MYRLLSDHFDHFRGQYEDVFEHEYGRWRRVVDTVVGRYLECGVLEAGFARVRCADCAAEYLLAFSCKTRYFCPSCHAKRLAAWTVWLDDELLAGPPHGLQAGWGALAPLPHGQMVFVLPKRLRPYFQWRRKLLGDLARIAARTATAFVAGLWILRELIARACVNEDVGVEQPCGHSDPWPRTSLAAAASHAARSPGASTGPSIR